MAQSKQKLLSLPGLRKRWSVSRFTLSRMIGAGTLPTVTIGKRRYVHIAMVEEIEAAGLSGRRASAPRHDHAFILGGWHKAAEGAAQQ
jgi:hypothetical protein